MYYEDLQCERVNIPKNKNIFMFSVFKLNDLSVTCIESDNDILLYNVSNVIEVEKDEKIKQLLLSQIDKFIVTDVTGYSGIYTDSSSFITIVSWVIPCKYVYYKKLIFFIKKFMFINKY